MAETNPKPKPPPYPLDPYQRRCVALDAEVHERTLLRFLRGGRLQPATERRILRALTEAGLLDLIP